MRIFEYYKFKKTRFKKFKEKSCQALTKGKVHRLYLKNIVKLKKKKQCFMHAMQILILFLTRKDNVMFFFLEVNF